MQKLLEAKLDQDDEIAINLLKTAYHIAKRELPKDEMKHMVKYASVLGVELSKADANVLYTSPQSVTELQSALADVILDDKILDIQQSGVFSLTIDESTDNGNLKRLIMYAQCVSETGLEYNLLTNKQILEGSADAKNIVSMVVEELKSKGLDITKLVGIGTDGASVMTGRKGGVVKLLQEHSPTLIGVHCAAHRIALATSQAAKFVPHMESYSRSVASVFRYFHNSALRSNRLRVIQNLLNIPQIKFAEVHSVRWLSLDHAVQVLYRTYPALCMALERDATYEPAAKGLLHEVSQYKFIAITHLMMDILPFMTRLSKKFQAQTLDFSSVKPMVTSTCESLQDLLEVDGLFVEKLSKFVVEEDGKRVYKRPLSESDCKSVSSAIKENIEFEGFSDESDDEDDISEENVGFSPVLNFYTQQENILNTITPAYVEKLTDNLNDRFQETEILESMKVLIPKNIVSADQLSKYGVLEVQKLADHFESHLLNKDEIRSEFQTYKRLVKGSHSDSSVVEVLCSLMKTNDLPNMILLLKCCAVIPMTSVQCERGFSTQNRIKSKARTSMKSKTLDDLMRISEDGPELEKFDFKRALKKWKSAKVRKLYSA
ncbi:zinc finger protein 862-like [Mercenaria mercenaria]|uniref:zinc finger protein 862-like n=1 Tax=Mercenaria mercenaria TaxID=6596 RepID=UPI00234EF42F|nr:zinc finger protein 862-like [Mercenaria mercenaria]